MYRPLSCSASLTVWTIPSLILLGLTSNGSSLLVVRQYIHETHIIRLSMFHIHNRNHYKSCRLGSSNGVLQCQPLSLVATSSKDAGTDKVCICFSPLFWCPVLLFILKAFHLVVFLQEFISALLGFVCIVSAGLERRRVSTLASLE